MRPTAQQTICNWNSPLSVVFDVYFGLTAAIFFLCFGLYGITVWSFFGSTIQLETLGYFLLSLIGIASSSTLIYVTSARAKTRFRLLMMALLVLGIGAAFVTIGLLLSNSSIPIASFVPAVIAVAAIKHLFMLSRVQTEVRP